MSGVDTIRAALLKANDIDASDRVDGDPIAPWWQDALDALTALVAERDSLVDALQRIAEPAPDLFQPDGDKGLLPSGFRAQHTIFSDKLQGIARAALAVVREPRPDREPPPPTFASGPREWRGDPYPIGAGTPHARMRAFWDRMSLAGHDDLIAELTGWNLLRSDYAYEDAIADAFDKLAAARVSVETPAPCGYCQLRGGDHAVWCSRPAPAESGEPPQ